MKTKNKKLPPIPYPLYPILCLLAFTVGCENGNVKLSQAEQIASLKHEKTDLIRQIDTSETEKIQLKKQLQTLSGVKPEVRLENFHDLQKVQIGKYTNLYDNNEDGKYEQLIVYLQPTDQDGDIVKATGAVEVQLWDLNKNNGQAMLGQWLVEPDQLRKLWFATLITINYRLTFDVADKVDNFDEPLTVKVTFTDYLTGKVFEQQKVIKP